MEPERGRSPATLVITLLTLAWLVGGAVLLVASLITGFQVRITAAPADPARQRHQDWLLLWFLAESVTGPVIIAIAAFAWRRVVTGWVFVTIAVLLAVPASIIFDQAWQELHPTPAVSPQPPGHCVELSGGDTRCPGG